MYYEVVNGLPESEIDQSALEELTRFVSVCNYALISFSISLREFTKWFLHGGWRTKRTKRFMKSMDFYLSLSRHNGDQSSIKNYFEVPDEINLVPLPVQRQQLPIAVQKPVVPLQIALVPTLTAPVRTQIPIKRPHVPPTVQGLQVCTQRFQVPTPQIAIQGQRPRVPPPVQKSQQRIPVPTQRFQEPTQRATRYDPSQIDQQLGGSSLGSAGMSTGAFQATTRPVQDYGLNRVQDQLFDFYRNAHCSIVKQKSNLSQSIAFDQSTFSHHKSSNLTPHCPSLRKPLNLSFQSPAPHQKLPNQSDSMFYRNSTSTPFIKDTSNPNKLLYPKLYPESTLPTCSIQHSNGTLPNFPRLLGPNHNLGDLRNGVVNNNRSIYPPQNFSRMPYRPKVSVSGSQAPRNQFANYDQAIHNQYPFGHIENSHTNHITKFAAENLQPKIGTNPHPKIYCYRPESNITQVLPAPSTNIPGPSAIPQQMRNEGNKVNVRPAELDLNIRAQDDGMPFTLGKPKFPSIASLLLHNSSVLNKSFQRTQFNQGRPELVHQENTVPTNPISFKPIHSNVPLIRTRPLSSEPILPKKSRPSSQIDRFPCPTTPPQNPLNMADWSGISFSPTEIRALMVPSPVKDDWIIRKDIFYTYENERSPGTFEKLRKVPGIFNSMKSLRECSFVLKKIRNGQYFIATVEITTDTTPQSKQPFTFYIQKLYHGNFKENLANQEAQMHQAIMLIVRTIPLHGVYKWPEPLSLNLQY